MQVARLPRDPGPAGWAALLPPADPPMPVDRDETTDWLVIGAGFAGLGAARRLSQLAPGDRITVLDAMRVGDGPAGRNSGFMIDLPHDLTSDDYGGTLDRDIAQTRANRHAISFAADMAGEWGLPRDAFDPCGKINGAASAEGAAHNRDYARHLSAMGESYEMLDARQMKDLTGTDYYQQGLFTPGAAMIQPARFVRGVAGHLRSNRVALRENSPVTGLERSGGDWVAQTPGGRVRAPRVILAVNGHLDSFGHGGGRLMHIFTYASMTRALTPEECARLGGAATWGLTPASPLGTTVRRTSGRDGDRIVIRNRFTFEPTPEVTDQTLARVCATHDRAFRARFPMLEGVEMEYRWGGRLCLTRNGVGVVGEIEPGLYSACVQNGLGTVRGLLAGLTAAEAATGQVSDIARIVLDEDAPASLPPRPIATLGARARLHWGEWRAGREL